MAQHKRRKKTELGNVSVREYFDTILTKGRFYAWADPAFQAVPIGASPSVTEEDTRWDNKMSAAYIFSIISEEIPSPIVLANVPWCLEDAVTSKRKHDASYFENLLKNQGTNFLIVDGANRTNAIKKFMTGAITIPVKNSVSIDDETYEFDENNNSYKTLHPTVKEAFDSTRLFLKVYTNCTRADLSNLFGSVNDGVTLNHAEKRNASVTTTQKYIRDLETKYYSFFDLTKNKIVGSKKLRRRELSDFFAKMLWSKYHGDKVPGNEKLDFQSFSTEIELLDHGNGVTQFEKTFAVFHKLVFDKGEKSPFHALTSLSQLFDLWVILCKMSREGLVIGDHDAFAVDYVKTCMELIRLSTEFPTTPGKSLSYKNMCGKTGHIVYRLPLVLKSFDYKNAKYLSKKDKRRSASPNGKVAITVEGDFKEGDTGKDIDLSSLHDGKKYHVGHKIPHSQGGKTEIENLTIQTAENNLKLGAKPVKEYSKA